jgi:dTDP-4-dehydrorhamnose 3,5-epimerase
MRVAPLDIPGLLLIEPARHGDARGFLSEVWSRRALAAAGLDADFVQDNHAVSGPRHVLRGLHFQRPPHAQGKLVRVARGAVLNVVVDLREGSPTYGRHAAIELSAANWLQIWIPRGFAHGYLTLEADTEVLYKADAYYEPAADAGILWSDPALGIAWPVADPILSERDRAAPRLAEIPPPFPPGSW